MNITSVRSRRWLAASVAAGALLAGGIDATAQTSTGVAFDEIIVTAQKRAENVQNVPSSISVISGKQIERFQATQLTDIGNYIPGFQVDSLGTPGQTALTIRGIATVGPGATVGVYLDDAPVGSSANYARSAGFVLDLLPYDIERVEVLRGPQGTLYGASSIGGLLKYVTKAPDLNKSEARAGVDVSTQEDAGKVGWATRVGLNAPIVADKLAIRLSYAYQDNPGYVDNRVTGLRDKNEGNQQGGRLALLWQPTDKIQVKLAGLWQKIDSKDNASVALRNPSQAPIYDARSDNNPLREPFKKDIEYYSATITGDLGWASLSSATAYSVTTTSQTQDASAVYGPLFPLFGAPVGLSDFTLGLHLKKLTQEVRLSSASGGRWEWQVGGYYTDETSKNVQSVRALTLAGVPNALDPLALAALPTTYKEYAGFGDLTFKVTEQFDITGGVRWAHNKQVYRQISSGFLLPLANVPGGSKESVTTFAVSPRFHLTQDTMIYGRIASGYRPGGPNATVPGAVPTVASDSLTNYEVGVKTELLDRRLLINAAAYFMDWKDIQLTVSSGGVSYLSNAGKASSKGLELTTAYIPVNGLTLTFNAAYTDSRLEADAPSVRGKKDDKLPGVPKWSTSAMIDYSAPIWADWLGRIGAGYHYTGSRISAVTSSPDMIPIKQYGAFDLNGDISNDRFTFKVFVKNVFDKKAYQTLSVVNDGFNQRAFIRGVPITPRTIGAGLDVKF